MEKAIYYFKKLMTDFEAANSRFYFGGGCVRNFFMKIPYAEWNDIDIWFFSETDKDNLLTFMTSNDGKITFSDTSNTMVLYKGKYYDFHHSWYGEPKYHMSKVEFTVNACFFNGEKFIYPTDFFQHLFFKKLVWHSFKGYYFEIALIRIEKMLKKGFEIDRAEIKRIAQNLEVNRDNYVKRKNLEVAE